MLLVVLTLFFLVLGCFLEGISILVQSSAVVLPMVLGGWHRPKLWFGIYIIVIIEIAQLTPPLGFNLLVLQSMTGCDIWWVTVASLPFYGLLLVAVLLIAIFPKFVTFLPDLMT